MSNNNNERYQIDSEVNKQLLFVYQDGVDNIRLAKRQQWLIGYYVILLYFAIVLASLYVPSNIDFWPSTIFAILLFLIMLVGIIVIWWM